MKKTGAIGLKATAGRYGGTYAHKDIAFEFGMWISAEFKIYLIKEFQRLKEDENSRLKLEWNLQRTLAKINYRIHTDAIKENLLPQEISKQQSSKIYADEADLLNVALFGKTIVVMTNLESINSVLIRQNLPQSARLKKLNETAILQMRSLLGNDSLRKLKNQK